MGMCKKCGVVFPASEMNDGFCKEHATAANIENQKNMEAENTELIKLKYKDTGIYKEAPLGFSWTTFFLGFFVPIFRGDLKWLIISLIITIFTFGFGYFLICFIYNKRYIVDLLEKGYIPADEKSKRALISKGMIHV